MHDPRHDRPPHVPWVDEAECIGCNLCSLVCPFPDCITMREVNPNAPRESWNDRLAADKIG